MNNSDMKRIFKQAELEMKELNHPYVGSEHLLLSILKEKNEVTSLFLKEGLSYNKFKGNLIDIVGRSNKKSTRILYTPLLRKIIDTAINDAEETNSGIVTAKHLTMAMIEEGEGIAIRLLLSLNIDLDKIYNELDKGKMGKKTLTVYEYGKVLNDVVDKKEKVVGREKEIECVIETLFRKNKNNPLLIGPAGVGKTAIVEELARRISSGNVPKKLENKEIISLDISEIVAGTKYRGEFEERLNKIIKEVINDTNIILFVDEIHTIVGAGGAEGAIDASNILKPYLSRGQMKCIGATTLNEYRKHIEKDKALERRFEVINVLEPNKEETITILKSVKKNYENHHNIKISDKNILDIVNLSSKYITNRCNPDKCLDVLDSVCAKLCLEEKDKITISDIEKIVENKTNANISNNNIIDLKEKLLSKVIGQNEQIDKIVDIIKQNKSLSPLSMLFKGSTGVGKTYMAKCINESIMNNRELIRLDMAEYNLETSINKLIGVSAGYVGYDDEYIFNKVKLSPYSLILVDDIEKASSKVLNLFYQILDEGFITDNKGEKINFNNTLIIFTTNEESKHQIGFSNKTSVDSDNIINKELLRRIDEVITFNPITETSVKEYLLTFYPHLNKKEVNNIIKSSEYEKCGFRNIGKLTSKIEQYN